LQGKTVSNRNSRRDFGKGADRRAGRNQNLLDRDLSARDLLKILKWRLHREELNRTPLGHESWDY
jgi:hypothetical protein